MPHWYPRIYGMLLMCYYQRNFDPVRYHTLSSGICQRLAGKRIISTWEMRKIADTPNTNALFQVTSLVKSEPLAWLPDH